MSWYHPAEVGFAVRSKLADLGYGARLFGRLLASVGVIFRRPGLVRDQIHFMGNYSLAIIAVSGIFVGFVLGSAGLLHPAALWLLRGARPARCFEFGA